MVFVGTAFAADRKKARGLIVDRSMTAESIPAAAKRAPTIAAVVGAYNAEQYIGETIGSLLSQTRPPDEIIVVDDGSTDSTREILESFGDRIRVVSQTNGGCPAAFNRAFLEATCDYVGMCGADDLWAPAKVEQQAAALTAHPEIDIAFGGSWSFGAADAPWPDPPGEGILDSARLMDALFRENIICASSILVRRNLWKRLGPFLENVNGERFACDDYEYWLRALAHGAVFHYGLGLHTLYRRHDANATLAQSWVCRSRTATHELHADAVSDARLVREILANDLRLQARAEVADGDMTRARSSFIRSMQHGRNLRAAAFVALLSLPTAWSRRLMSGWVDLRPTLVRVVARMNRLRRRSSALQEGASA